MTCQLFLFLQKEYPQWSEITIKNFFLSPNYLRMHFLHPLQPKQHVTDRTE